eukprot:TRINITY_DN1331_c0_g1_i2.p1 TRINITY_DN1331_c0_g1~~TRINITY_DN1331_c0_g1_i2.p1  ORF type:complete len:389 (-),score=91.86 TRINITY_DN1331_c0_g1_i2:924-2090(-)
MEAAEAAKAAGNDAWRLGDLDEAVRCFSRAIDLAEGEGGNNANLPVYYSNRSAAYLKQGDGVKALLDAEKCTTLDETWAKGWGRKGAALMVLKRYAHAAQAYKTGMELDPNNTDSRKGYLDAQRLAAAAAANATAATGSGGTIARVRQFFKANMVLTYLAVLRAVLIVNALLFLMPYVGGVNAYKRAMLLHLVVMVGMLYKSYGFPQRNLQYLQQVVMDPVIQQIGIGFIFYMQRPYILGLLMVLLPATVQYLWYLSCLLQYCNMTSALTLLDKALAPVASAMFNVPNWAATPVANKWPRAVEQATMWTAQFQVAFGLLLIFELVLPRRNLVMLLLYWQILRMGVMLEAAQTVRGSQGSAGARDGALTNAFKQLHARILGKKSSQIIT